MRFLLISDNHDTAVGMRLAGIDGCIVHTPEELLSKINDAASDPEIAIVLVTSGLYSSCASRLDALKLTLSRPIIVEIPDRHVTIDSKSDSILRCVEEAVGIRL